MLKKKKGVNLDLLTNDSDFDLYINFDLDNDIGSYVLRGVLALKSYAGVKEQEMSTFKVNIHAQVRKTLKYTAGIMLLA